MTYNELLSNKINKNENEEMFQKAWDNNDWDTIWLCTFRCCNNVAKSIYRRRNVIIPDEDFLEKITDATAYCVKFFKKGVRPNKLSSYTYLRVLRYINDKKEIEISKNETQFLYDEEGRQLEVGEWIDDKDKGEEY